MSSAPTARLLEWLRSPWVRRSFVLLALAAAVWAVTSQWDEVRAAVSAISAALLLASLLASIAYVALTMLAWRAVLIDLGSRLPMRTSAAVFFVSQLGKYLPGGLWNVLAAAEMGADHQIPRRRSVSVMVVSILVSIVTGLGLAVVAVVLAPDDQVAAQYGWVAWTLPAFLVALAPPVLNRLLALALRLAKRPPLEHPLTARGTIVASLWSLAAWVVAGVQVWLLATALDLPATGQTLALAVGGYALAWTVGFLVFFVPAGVGVREAVLAAVLAGNLATGAVVVVVLLSRVLLTLADLLTGLVGFVLGRRNRSRPHAPADPAPGDRPRPSA